MIAKSNPPAQGTRRPRRALRRSAAELVVAVVVLLMTSYLAKSMLYPHAAPAAGRQPYQVDPAILRAATTANPCILGEVALTFDDGPDLYTRPILDVLRAYGAPSTFFVLGSKAVRAPDLIRAAVADGHRIENHSWDHPHLVDLSVDQIRAEIAETQRAIVAAGAPVPTMLRPPFGSTDATVSGEATAQNLRVVRWSVDTNDWRGRAPADITKAILDSLAPGAVILLHDGTRESINTARALPDIIAGIRARGYCTALMR